MLGRVWLVPIGSTADASSDVHEVDETEIGSESSVEGDVKTKEVEAN
jgi:hypothetical protein